MKKSIILSSLLVGSCLYAGGDIAPVAEPIMEIPQIIDESGLYIGLGYGMFNQLNESIVVSNVSVGDIEYDVDTVVFQVGYKFNNYVAVEARGWYGVSDLTQTRSNLETELPGTYNAMGVYLKPMYPVTNDLDIYALVGYSSTTLEMDNGGIWDTDGLSYGGGVSYSITESLSVFVDYVMMATADEFDYDTLGTVNQADITVTTINAGVSYKF